MNRLARWCALLLLALGVCFLNALPARAATATATLRQGPLSVTPSYVTLTYHASGRGAKRTIAASFSANVTDARGTKAGWEISATTIGTTGPSGYFPTDAHVITDFNIIYANGTPPDPTGPCNVIPTTPGMILHNRPEAGMGQSIESFATQLTLPADARGGAYSATLMLTIAPIGTINAMPGARPPGAPPSSGVPSPAPTTNPNPAPRIPQGSASVPGTPETIPVARTNGGFPLPSPPNYTERAASTTGTQRVVATNDDAPVTRPAMVAGTLNSGAPNAATTAATATQAGAQSSTTSVTAATNGDTTNVVAPVASPPASTAVTTVNANPGPRRVVSSDPSPIATTSNPAATSSAFVFPVIALSGETLTLTLPFVPSLYDPVGVGPSWHLQTTFALLTASSHEFASTMPIRSNAGHLFSTVVNPETNQATITFNPLLVLAARGDTAFGSGSAVLIVTIVTGP